MSLVRWLTAGKALVGMDENVGRYQVTRQRLLPHFGGENGGANRPQAVANTPSAKPADPAPVDVPPTRTWWSRLLSFFQWSPRPMSSPIPRFGGQPTQGELSLDAVKVVRNDLSDSDLEVVAAGPKKMKPKTSSDAKVVGMDVHALSKQ